MSLGTDAGLRDRLFAAMAGDALPLVAPGAYDALSARLIEMSGFEAVYLSGAGIAYTLLAAPDIGLVTLSEMAERAVCVARATSLPVIADGDNGHGDALNTRRTVELFERAGVVAMQLEDQVSPKRCGHLAGKRLVPVDEAVGKIRAAVDARASDDFLVIGRTDARSVEGLDPAIERAKRYRDAGADVLFVEAPMSVEELEIVATALPDVPLMANMVEGGRTPLLSTEELGELGYALVLYPNSILRRFVPAAQALLAELRDAGTTAGVLDDMVDFDGLNDIVGLGETQAIEARFSPGVDADGVAGGTADSLTAQEAAT